MDRAIVPPHMQKKEGARVKSRLFLLFAAFVCFSSWLLAQEYRSDTNTVLLLHMNETSGSTVSDASSFGNHGAATGTTIVDGRFGRARRFSDEGQYVGTNRQPLKNLNFTAEAWINASNLTKTTMIFLSNLQSGADKGYFLDLRSTGKLHFAVGDGLGGDNHLFGNSSLTVNSWYHVAASYDGSKMRIYLNGVIDAETSWNKLSYEADNLFPFKVGDHNFNLGETGSFDGLIDEVRISNVARSPNEFNLQLPPRNLTASTSGTSINLNWQNGGGAVGLLRYRVYRGTDSTNVSLIDSTTSTSYQNSSLTTGTRYFYRVSAVDSTRFEGAKSYAASAIVSTGSLPLQPSLQSPPNGAADQNTRPTLSWTASSGATNYHLQVSQTSSFSTTVFDDTTITATSRQVGPLQNNRTFYWRVRAKNGAGWSNFSSSFSFKTRAAPTAATISIRSSFTSPGSRPTGLAWDGRNLWMIDNLKKIYKMDTTGAVLSSFTAPGSPDLDLSWDGTGLWIGGGQGYGFGRNMKLDSVGNRVDSLDVSHWAFSGFEWDGKFFWISDYNSSLIYKHARDGSALLNFGVDISAARPNSLSYDGAYLWIGSPGSNINKYSTTGQLLGRFNTGSLGISSTTSSVVAWDGESLWFAKTDQFTIYRLNVPYYHQAPFAPTLASPADGATDLALTPTLTWNQSLDASTYRLQVSTNAAFTTLAFNDSTLTDTLKQVGPLTEGRTYYWRVYAKNSGGTSTPSSTRSFSTAGALPPGTGVVHVSTSGNDANAGTSAAPLRNIQTALTRASSGDTIKVAGGSYAENLTTASKVNVRGGYDATFSESTRNLFKNKTSIRPTSGTMLSDGNSSTVDGFVFDGSGGAGKGVLVTGGNSTVTHNIVRGVAASGGSCFEVATTAAATIKNNTAANNILSGGGVIVYSFYIRGNAGGATVVQNNIAYNNNVGISISASGVTAGYNCAFGNTYQNFDLVTAGATDLVKDPKFVNPAGGDFRLRASSPGMNAGNPSDAVREEPAPNGNRIDLGAYGGTKNATPNGNPSTYVATTGNDSNDGSITAPFKTIQTALNNALGDTVKVAAGSYSEGIVTASQAILLGGYDNTFAESRRDIYANRTTLLGISSTMVYDRYGSTFDGFFVNGNAVAGTGFDVSTGSTISHNVIVGVTASFGYAINISGNATVVNSTLRSNTRAVTVENGAAGTVVKNNIFANNTFALTNSAANGIARYNDYFSNSANYLGQFTTPGTGDLAVNPQFRDVASNDFRLAANSPCIDAGDPTDPVGDEPEPNGGRIDLGAYGGTKHSPYRPPPPLTEKEPNNTAPQANTITLDDSIFASISPSGDVDYFNFIGTAGDTVDIATTNAMASDFDGYLRLHNAQGEELYANDDFTGPQNSRITHILPSTGNYYIRYTHAWTGGEFPNSATRARYAGLNVGRGSEKVGRSATEQSRSALPDTGSYRLVLQRFKVSGPHLLVYGPYDLFSNSARIDGNVYSNGLNTTVTVQYGTTTSYGSSVTVPGGPFNSINEIYFGSVLTGLSPATTYHYRVVAVNGRGSFSTSDETFTTPAAPEGWSRQTSGTTESLLGIAFVSSATGTAVGATGTILRTTNGGTQWTIQNSNTYESLRSVSFADASVGVAVGDAGTILRTTNGGSTWLSQISPVNLRLSGVHLIDADTGIAVGDEGSILTTTNGGSNWQIQSSGTNEHLSGVHFAGSSLGLTVGTNGTILRTTDGGTSWQKVASSTSEFLDKVIFADPTTAYSVGTGGVILKSTDAGVSWAGQNSGTEAWLTNLAFLDANTGMVVGENGVVLTTSNGGQDWKSESSGTLNFLGGVSFTGAESAIAVGEYGTVLVKRLGQLPLAVTTNATSITPSSAELNGTVNPNGMNATAWFEYGTSNTLATSSSTPQKTVFAATSNVAFSDGVTGLVPGTTYYFRVVAENSAGSDRGSIVSFITAPTAPALVAPANGATSQPTTVTCSWNAVTGATLYRLQISTSDSFASLVFDDSTITSTSRQVGSLANNTLYYWRVSAKNASGSGSISFPYTFTTIATTPAAPTSPTLSSPANGASNQPTTLTLGWSVSTGATAYRLQVSTTQAFTSTVFDDSTITTASKQIGPLANNTTYYWRVNAKNTGGTSLFTSAFAFTTVATATVAMSTPLSFPISPTSSTDYRLMSIPGDVGSLTVADVLSGTQKTDWRVYRDNGAASNFLTELSSSSTFGAGEGYWILKKGALTISRTVSMPTLNSDGTYSIQLHAGWNIIGNPFNQSVPWTAVRSSNDLSSSLQPLTYNGTYVSGSTLEPFAGYYFDNRTAGLAQLKIPFPFPSTRVNGEEPPPVDWMLQLVFQSDINVDRENYIGVAPSASLNRDEMDNRKPPLFLDQGFLYFDRPQWDEEYRRFAGDFRPSLGDGQVWDFEVANPRLSQAKITVRGLEKIPSEYDVTLLSLSNTIPIDLRTTNEYSYKTVSERMQFKLIVGKRSYVQGEVEKLVPESFALEQNYPNPFNPTTSITFTLPREAGVQVEVFSPVGQLIRTITDRAYPAGIHTVLWEAVNDQGEKVASGMYFYRLVADGVVVKTRKMIVLK